MALPRSEKTIEKRRALRRHLAGLGSVMAVDAVDDQPGAAALEIVTAPRLERVPPAIVRAIGEHDHGIGIVQRQGDHWIVEVR
ncbi:MAG: hypothetical protein ACOCUA_02345 [archaeon]